MSTSPQNDYYRLKLCRLSGTMVTSAPPKIPLPGAVFGGLQTPYAEIPKFLKGVRSGTHDSCLLFQTRSKSVQNKCPKGRIVLVTKKHSRRTGPAPLGASTYIYT